MASYVTHLEAAIDGTRLAHDRLQTLHEGRPLLVRYDLDAIRAAADRDEVARRAPTLWRYRELLPVERDENVVSLGEGMSPLLPCPRLGAELGLARLWIKDEGQLPTGSFKARGLGMAVSRAKELGAQRLAIPTAGNAGGALAAYAARAGIEAWVFMPSDTPIVNKAEAALFGARAFEVDGLITDCGAIVAAGKEAMGWFDVSTLKEPYRIEGKKTMGLELAEQLGWRLPDAILYPTGGGTGLIGMWKAFAELRELGWLDSAERLPRMVACQSDGCDPIIRAFDAGERFAEMVEDAHTIASGLRVPKAVGDFLILDAVRASNGTARRAPEGALVEWTRRASALEGIALCPEAAACLATLAELVREGWLAADEEVVVFNTGAAQKYVEAIECELPSLGAVAPDAIDWAALQARA
ncbi:MAG: threonine synthase [Planctomycetota bacterium]